MSAAPFAVGRLSDGRTVRAVRLEAGDLAVEVWDYGCTIRSFRKGALEALVGPADLGGVEADQGYFGRVVGRVANRIGGARFELDGEERHLDANEGANTLHGGSIGWSHAVWRIEAADGRRCVLSHVSPDGDMGFAGEVHAQVTLSLADDHALEIVWEARTDAATPVNLTHHLYFNLAGRPGTGVLDHGLSLPGSTMTVVGAGLIPTGELAAVDGGPFDLREPRPVRSVAASEHPQAKVAGGLDHNWALDASTEDPKPIVLSFPPSGASLEVVTDQPGVQVYDGHGIAAPLAPYAGLAIEPQGFPDAPNQPTFPSVTLRPGETYRRRALYRLRPE